MDELIFKTHNNIFNSLPPELNVTVDEEGKINRVRINTKSLEKNIKTNLIGQPITHLPYFLSRLSTNNSLNIEHACISIIEKMANIENSEDIRKVRVILLEFSRIMGHIDYFIKISKALTLDSIVPELLTYKSKIKELLENLSGAKSHFDIFRVGGFKNTIKTTDLLKILKLYKELNNNLSKTLELFESDVVHSRTENVGTYKKANLYKICLSGINLRASGIQYDIRLEKPYECYKQIKFTVPAFTKNDCYNRILTMISEIESSFKIIYQCIELLPSETRIHKSNITTLDLEKNIAIMDVELNTGKFELKLKVSNKNEIADIEFITPTQRHLQAIENFLIGEDLEDLNLIFASLNLDFNEVYGN